MTFARFISRVAFSVALTPLVAVPFRSGAAQIQMWDVGVKVGAEAPAAVVEGSRGER